MREETKETSLILHNFLYNFKFGSITLWIINILQVCSAILEVALTDLGITMIPAFYKLSAINLGIGGGIIMGRLVIGFVMAYKYDVVKSLGG